MKTTPMHLPRMALAIGLLVTVLSPAAVSAQSDLDTSEAEAFIGDWNLPMDSEFGSFELLLERDPYDTPLIHPIFRITSPKLTTPCGLSCVKIRRL